MSDHNPVPTHLRPSAFNPRESAAKRSHIGHRLVVSPMIVRTAKALMVHRSKKVSESRPRRPRGPPRHGPPATAPPGARRGDRRRPLRRPLQPRPRHRRRQPLPWPLPLPPSIERKGRGFKRRSIKRRTLSPQLRTRRNPPSERKFRPKQSTPQPSIKPLIQKRP